MPVWARPQAGTIASMKRGEVSFLVLITLIVCGSYVLGSPGTAREALAAQAATPSSAKKQEPAYKLCPPQTATERYSSSKPIYPNKYQVPDPVRGGFITITNLYGKSCSTINEELRIYIRSACRGPWDCRAIEYVDESGKIHPVTNDRFNSSPPVPCTGGGLIISTACGADTPPKLETPQIPTPPTTQGNEIINAFNPQQTPATPAQNQAGQAAPAGQEVTPPASSLPSAAPIVPAGSPGSAAALPVPDNPYTAPALLQAYRSFSIFPQQITFPSSYSPQSRTQESRVQSSMNAFAPSFAPMLLNSLLPATLAPLRTFTQLLFAPIIPIDRPGVSTPSQNPARGRQLVVYELTLPPPPQRDTDEMIPERQREETLGPTMASEGTVTTGAGAFYAGQKITDATSTGSTSNLRRIESTVVDIAVPVDITDPASYQPTFAPLDGDWTRLESTAVKNKLALAEAEAGYSAITAQMGALREAQAADLCGEECDASLASLQNQLSIWQSDIDEFGAIVRNDAAPRPSSPPPTVAQVRRFAGSFAEPSYQVSTPRSAAETPAAVSVFEQEAVPKVPQTTSERIATRIVQGIWNFLKSIFLPPTTESAKPRASCSLFASLFGRCK